MKIFGSNEALSWFQWFGRRCSLVLCQQYLSNCASKRIKFMALIFSEIVLWHSGSVGSRESCFADKKLWSFFLRTLEIYDENISWNYIKVSMSQEMPMLRSRLQRRTLPVKVIRRSSKNFQHSCRDHAVTLPTPPWVMLHRNKWFEGLSVEIIVRGENYQNFKVKFQRKLYCWTKMASVFFFLQINVSPEHM